MINAKKKPDVEREKNCKNGKPSKGRLSVISVVVPLVKTESLQSAVMLHLCIQRTMDRHLPVDWSSNKSTWMTQIIFSEWLEDLNHVTKNKIGKQCRLLTTQLVTL